MKIETKDKQGRPNGWVQPIWNANESIILGRQYRPDQVYLTVVLPGTRKGPHLHKKRTGLFSCISGSAAVIVRSPVGDYSRRRLDYYLVPVLPGNPCEIVCVGDEPAYILNLCSPAYSASDPDEWDVTDWNPPELTHA